MEKKRYPANTAIFFQDDPADALYILTTGSAKVYQTSESGKDRILRILKPGNVFGELAMIEGDSRYVSVQTLEDCEVLRLARKAFVEFGDKHTWVLWKLLASFARRIRRRNEDVLDLTYRDVPYRVLHALQELVEDHGAPGPGGTRIAMDMSVRDVASMVGSTPETVGRLLNGYETDGLLKRNGATWTVPDPKALVRIIEYVAQQDA